MNDSRIREASPPGDSGRRREAERLTLVLLHLCEPCRTGEGGECHTPGCALWMNRAPDVPVDGRLLGIRAKLNGETVVLHPDDVEFVYAEQEVGGE